MSAELQTPVPVTPESDFVGRTCLLGAACRAAFSKTLGTGRGRSSRCPPAICSPLAIDRVCVTADGRPARRPNARSSDAEVIVGPWALVITSAPTAASLATSASNLVVSTIVIHGHRELWWKRAKPSAHICSDIWSARSTGSGGIGAQKASAAK